MKYQFIAEYQHEYPITLMCRVLEVSVSGDSAWRKRAPSEHSREDTQLAEKVKTAFQANRCVYGSPRVHAELGLPRFERVGELGIDFVKKGKPRCRKTNERLRRSLNRRRCALRKRAGRALQRLARDLGSPIVPCITGANWSLIRESKPFLGALMRHANPLLRW